MSEGFSALLQSLLWLAVVIVVLFLARKRLAVVTDALAERLRSGASVKFGNILELSSPPAAILRERSRVATAEGSSGAGTPEETGTKLQNKQYPAEITDSLYILHAAEVVRARTEKSHGLYRVRVWLEGDSPRELDSVTRVHYRLHDSFRHPVISTEAREKESEVWLNVYGEFAVVACVERKERGSCWLT